MCEPTMIVLLLACSSQLISEAEKESVWEFIDEELDAIEITSNLSEPMGMIARPENAWNFYKVL